MTAPDLTLEDLHVGQVFHSPECIVTADEIQAFAVRFDPQPAHLDDARAQGTLFKGLAASGWHTAALTMRLLVDSPFKPAGGIIGTGFDSLRWTKPVRPGDVLRVEVEVMALRPSASNSTRGVVTIRSTTFAGDAPVQVMTGTLVVQRRG